MESGPRPWFQRAAPSGDSATPRLCLSAGIHGDEISGPLALVEMIRQPDSFDAFDVTMFPILNPNGLARGVPVRPPRRNHRWPVYVLTEIDSKVSLTQRPEVDDGARVTHFPKHQAGASNKKKGKQNLLAWPSWRSR
jgi:predicted deacylase